MNRRQRRKIARNTKQASPGDLALAERALAQGDFHAAVGAYRRMVKADPGMFAAWANLGAACLQLDDVESARKAFEKAHRLQPDSIDVLNNLATMHARAGNRDKAVATYRQVLELQPDNAETWLDLAQVKRFSTGDPDIDAMAALEPRLGLESEQAMFLAFAMGKALEDAGEYGSAFTHYAAANRLKRAAVDFDIAAEAEGFTRLKSVFEGNLFARNMMSGVRSARPIFIVGMPRSGTTLVEQILASHEQVYGAGELTALRHVAVDGGFPESIVNLTGPDFEALANAYLGALPAPATAERVTDKMPANFQLVGMIQLMFPGAPIIHCRRSPLDTCLSCFALHFPQGQAFSYALDDLGRYYRLYDDLMAHWHAVLPGRILDVHYENVIDDPENQVRRVLEYCRLPWQDTCLDFHNTSRTVATASAAQVREPLYRRSLARWRHFEAELSPLRNALGGLADQEAEA